MISERSGFATRPNPDGSFDSICLHCFRTVATRHSKAELVEVERGHRCETVDLDSTFVRTIQAGASVRFSKVKC
jgi:hypothetical protein